MTHNKRIEKMTPGEISLLTKEKKEALFQESVVHAIGQSIEHKNSEPANALLKLQPQITKKPGAKEALIKYFETWGNLCFDSTRGTLRYSKGRITAPWGREYEAAVAEKPWTKLIRDTTKATNHIHDADKEFRTVLERLKRFAADPSKTVIHEVLIMKVQEVLYAYGRTDDCFREQKRGRTLFDRSTQMSTFQATKFAK